MNRITRALASTVAFASITGAALAGASPAGAQDGVINDSYAAPTALASQANGQVAGSNVGATLQPGETQLGAGGGSSVHYSIVAPASGRLQVSTSPASFDTQLGVGTGDSAASLVFLAENDDANGTLQSEVTVDVTAGQTYRIVVDGYRGAEGTFDLSWNLDGAANPGTSNDQFATPTELPSQMQGQVAGNNNGATLEAGEPAVSGVGASSVHYSIVAPVTGTLQVSTAGSGYDTALGLGQGASAAGLVFAGQNDDANGTLQSEVTIDVTAGQTYRIVVDGYRGAQGDHTLSWTFTGQPATAGPGTGGPGTGGPGPVAPDMQTEFVRLINEARSQARLCGGDNMAAVPPVVADAVLAEASRLHSVDMATNNYFSHTGLNGSSPWDRARDAGTTANGENIQAGAADVAGAVEAWLNSPPHCRGIMSPDATRAGVGLGTNPASQFGNYWTMMTGA